MKEFKTSEDLDQLSVSIPLNKARSLLTMAFSAAEKALYALLKAEDNKVNLGAEQKAALEAYVEGYKLCRDLISDAIVSNLTVEQQEAIREYEGKRAAILKDELIDTVSECMQDGCDDPNCEACTAINKVLADFKVPSKQDPKTEFDLDDLPDGTFIVPGSDEEN